MIYVFDNSSLNILKDYYPERFTNFWKCFNDMVTKGDIISVREVYKELDGKVDRPHIQEWIHSHREIFLPPSPEREGAEGVRSAGSRPLPAYGVGVGVSVGATYPTGVTVGVSVGGTGHSLLVSTTLLVTW